MSVPATMNSIRAFGLGLLLLAGCTEQEDRTDDSAPPDPAPSTSETTPAAEHDPVVELRRTLMTAPLSVPRVFIAARSTDESPPGDILGLRTRVSAAPRDHAARLALAEALRQVRDYAAAEEHYKEAIRLVPRQAAAATSLARLLLSQGRYDDAVQILDNALKATQPTAELHFLRGALAARQQREDEAVGSLRQAVSLDPRHARAHFDLARALHRQGSTTQAIAALRSGLDEIPGSVGLRLKLAGLLALEGDDDDALVELRALIKADPSLTSAYIAMASIHRHQHDVGAARDAIDAGLEVESSNVDLFAELGLLLLEQGQRDEAVPYLERAIYRDPDLLEACSALAGVYERTGDDARAQILKEYAEHVREHEAELRSLKTAIGLDKSDAHAFFAVGTLYTHLVRPLAASQALEVGLQFIPDNVKALNSLGLVLLSLRQLPRAIETYEQLLAIDSTFVAAYANLGTSLAVSGESKRAIATFERALTIKPDFAPAHMGLARTYERLGQKEKAAAALADFKRLSSESTGG